jgi:ketosteroid isomerase-like protein
MRDARATRNRSAGRLVHLALTLSVSSLAMSVDAEQARAQSAEAAVTEVVDAYHAALVSGDSTTALSLLAEDVTILESGGVEDKEHYRSGHLAGDMRFAAAVPRERSDIRVTVLGDVAWAWSTNTAQGQMGEREVNSRGAELMVLARTNDRWMIRAIHWSSRAAR